MEQLTRKYLLLFKLDAGNLLSRLMERRAEYLEIFALRRTREHFEKVFFTRYYEVKLSELVYLSEEIIKRVDAFYHLVDDLHWYVYSTQDMPGAVGEELDRYLAQLNKALGELDDEIKQELGIEDVPDIPTLSMNDNVDDLTIDEEPEEIHEEA